MRVYVKQSKSAENKVHQTEENRTGITKLIRKSVDVANKRSFLS